MFYNRCCEAETNNQGMNMNMNMNPNMMMNCCNNTCPPIIECPEERVCHTNTCYEVPHIIPKHTRIINHHIYRHTYQPVYTCSMEDEVSNVYENRCNF